MPNLPRPAFFIRLTHTGLHADGRPNLSAVLIPDLDVGYENQDRKVPVYVPVGGHIDINASSRSMLSFEQGGIKKLSAAGILTSKMFYVPESYDTAEFPAATLYPEGTLVWSNSENKAYWSDGTDWVTTISGGAPSGAASGDLGLTYPGPSVVGIQGRPVSAVAPAVGQAYVWNGTDWTPTNLATPVTPVYATSVVTGSGTLANSPLLGQLATVTATTKAGVITVGFQFWPGYQSKFELTNNAATAATVYISLVVTGTGNGDTQKTLIIPGGVGTLYDLPTFTQRFVTTSDGETTVSLRAHKLISSDVSYNVSGELFIQQ